MKFVIVFALAVVAVAVAVPVEYDPLINSLILRSNFEQQPKGDYQFGFETDKGILRQEEGQVKQVVDEENKPHDVVVVRGSYSYPKDDGKPETVNYYADETGFHAEGDSIPKPVRR